MAQDTQTLDGSPISTSVPGNTSTDIVEPIGGDSSEVGAGQSNLANEYTNWSASNSGNGNTGTYDATQSANGQTITPTATDTTATDTTTTETGPTYATEVNPSLSNNGRTAGQLAQTVGSTTSWDDAINATDSDFQSFITAQQSVTGSATSEAIAKLAGDNAEVINQMYDAQEQSIESQYWAQYNQSQQQYQKTYQETMQQYNEAMNTQVRQDAIGYRNMLGQLAYNGVNTGVNSQAMLAMQTNADNNFLELNKAKADALADLAQDFANYEANLKIEITKALADNDYQRATALYQESQNADALALQSAQIKAEYGDFSGYSDLGWDKDTVNQMKKTWAGSNAELALSTGLLDELYADKVITLSEFMKLANPWTVEGSSAWYTMQKYKASNKNYTPTMNYPDGYTNPNSGGGTTIISPDGSSSGDYRKPDPNEDGTYETDVGAVVDFTTNGEKKTYTEAEFKHLCSLIQSDFEAAAKKFGYDITTNPNKLFEDLLTDGVKAQEFYQEIQSMCSGLLESGYLGQNALSAMMQNEFGETALQYVYMAGMNCTVEAVSNTDAVKGLVTDNRTTIGQNYTKEMQEYMGGKSFDKLTDDQVTWLAMNVAADPTRFGLKEGDKKLSSFTTVAEGYNTELSKYSPFTTKRNVVIDAKTGERKIVYTQMHNLTTNANGTPMWILNEDNEYVMNPKYYEELTDEEKRIYSVAYTGNADSTVVDFSKSIVQANSYLASACKYYNNYYSKHSFMSYDDYKKLGYARINGQEIAESQFLDKLASTGTGAYTAEQKRELILKAISTGTKEDWMRAASVCGYQSIDSFKNYVGYSHTSTATGTNTGVNISANTKALGIIGGQDVTGKSDADIISDNQKTVAKDNAAKEKADAQRNARKKGWLAQLKAGTYF